MTNILKYCILLILCFSTLSTLKLEARDIQKDSLIKHCLSKLDPIYPKTVAYLKNHQLTFIAVRLYYRYLSSLTPKNSKLIDEQLRKIERAPALRMSIDESQMEQLWNLIPIYSQENRKNGKNTIIFSLIATNIYNNAYDVCDFLLKKLPEINDENLKRRLLFIALLRNMSVKKENFHAKKMKDINNKIAKGLNSLSDSTTESGRKTSILIYALMEGLDINKNLIIKLYMKHNISTRRALRKSIREIPPDSNKNIVLKTDNEFIDWINKYKIGTRLTLPIQ